MAHLLRKTPWGCGMSKDECNKDLQASKAAAQAQKEQRKAQKDGKR